ncbi:MSHA biogenesis protein MshF [Vibrio sp. PID23_8]|uniref:MSHA biogenesis protein MshF n=1 Tax=unclassified Vibrio TaxID=2614977 RepID=UPI000E69DCA6|nr:MSHA biogenesis protein MshF [Vibrio sp. PID23_8]RIZ52299.1 MSHA biogenesis protein MshF [Vibrio sp. PID23_8]
MVENQTRASAILGGFVVVILLVALIYNLKPIEQQGQATGVNMAKAWMQDSVLRYRHAWLLNGEPKTLSMDGFELLMTDEGLVSPFVAGGALDCDYWLTVHFPQRSIMSSELLETRGVVKSNHFLCDYAYENGYKIVVNSSNNYLKLSVKRLAE